MLDLHETAHTKSMSSLWSQELHMSNAKHNGHTTKHGFTSCWHTQDCWQHPINWKGKWHELQSICPHDQNWNRWKSEVGWINRWSDSADLFCPRRWNLTHIPLRKGCQIPESTIQNMMRWLFHWSPEKYPKWFIVRSNDLQTNSRRSVAQEERLPNKGRVRLDLSWHWSRSSTE